MADTYDPELYDVATPDSFRGDLDWYRRKARESGGPVQISGGFTGQPFANDTDELVVEARRS